MTDFELAVLRDVTKRYGSLTAVSGVSLELRRGETLALVGHNGAGKTTLAKLILGLTAPTEGQVRVFGCDPATHRGANLRASVGFLPENVAFHGAMTGRELLRFYARLKRTSLTEVDGLFERVGLDEAAGRRVATYSKGMRQRLGLAQALIGRPELLLLDEPTSGLDPVSRTGFYETIDELRGEGVTVLVSTHALAEIDEHADRVAVMHQGRLTALGSMDELRRAAALPMRIRFVVTPCSTGRLIDRLGQKIEVIDRTERTLEIGCDAADKAAVIQNLGELWSLVEDISLKSPDLPAIYQRLVDREESS